MRDHLYIVRQVLDGDEFLSPCVGEDELAQHVTMVEHFGARLLSVADVEYGLAGFVRCCYLEGLAKRWMNG